MIAVSTYAALPRRSKLFAVLVLVAFLALVAFGPLSEATGIERAFSLTLLLAFITLVAMLTRRLIFALALAAVIFGGVLISSYIKFHYLTTPLLAPDLVYFVNRDLLEVATRYPPIMIAIITAVILIPTLLIARMALGPAERCSHGRRAARAGACRCASAVRSLRSRCCCSPHGRADRSLPCSTRACGRR